MAKERQAELLSHLRAELAARRRYLEFWKKQEPIELFSPPVFLLDIRSNLIGAAEAEIAVMEQAIEVLQKDDTQGP